MRPEFSDSASRRQWISMVWPCAVPAGFFFVYNIFALPSEGIDLRIWREGQLQWPWVDSPEPFFIVLIAWTACLIFSLLTLSYLSLPSESEAVPLLELEIPQSAAKVRAQISDFAHAHNYLLLKPSEPTDLKLAHLFSFTQSYGVERAGNIGYLFLIRLHEVADDCVRLELRCQRWRAHFLLAMFNSYADRYLYPQIEKRPPVTEFRERMISYLDKAQWA